MGISRAFVNQASTTQGPSLANSLTLTLSEAPLPGDLLILGINQNPYQLNVYGTMTVPAYFVAKYIRTISDTSKLYIYSRMCDGTEGTTIDMSVNTTCDGLSAFAVVYRPDSGYMVKASRQVFSRQNGNSTTWTIPSVSTVHNNSIVLAIFCKDAASGTNPAAAIYSNYTNSYNEVADTHCVTPNAYWAGIGAADRSAPTPGDTGTATLTSAKTDGNVHIAFEIYGVSYKQLVKICSNNQIQCSEIVENTSGFGARVCSNGDMQINSVLEDSENFTRLFSNGMLQIMELYEKNDG